MRCGGRADRTHRAAACPAAGGTRPACARPTRATPLTSLTAAYSYGYGGYSSSPAEGFILGILFLVVAVVVGFVSLLVNYLLSELVGIFADIARDVRAMRKGNAEGA